MFVRFWFVSLPTCEGLCSSVVGSAIGVSALTSPNLVPSPPFPAPCPPCPFLQETRVPVETQETIALAALIRLPLETPKDDRERFFALMALIRLSPILGRVRKTP